MREAHAPHAGDDYTLVLMPAAVKALENNLKPAVAFALYEFMDTVLCAQPRRVGKPLTGPANPSQQRPRTIRNYVSV